MASLMPFCGGIMQYIQRQFPEITDSFFLFGPRGTGKSTLIRNRYQDAIWVDLLKPETLRRFLARPERLEHLIAGEPEKKTIVIDEIQKAPELLSVVHSLIEEKKNLQFILTGSSARKLKRASINLLGGRALKRTLHPFIAAELGNQFSLSRALHEGTLPLIYTAANPADSLRAYIDLYLHEEIYTEGLVRNIENFSRFLEVISFSHGGLLNTTNISRECEVKRKTVENYIDILDDLLLAYRIPVFTRRAQRELSSHPKFYLFDSGVYTALRPQGPLDQVEEMNGAGLEGLVAQHLLAWIDYSNQNDSLSFWRTRSGVEVDFVIYGSKHFYAIEVKNSSYVDSQDLKSLEAFLVDYPMAKAFLLYRGNEKLKIKNVHCIPCEEFLKKLISGKEISE